MNRLFTVLAAIFMLAFLTTSASADDTKIVYIDILKIRSESAMGKDLDSQLGFLKQQKDAEIKARQDKINRLSQSLQGNTSKMSAVEKADLEAQYQRALNEYDRFVQDNNDEMKRMDDKLSKPWGKELEDIIKTYAEKNGIVLVLKSESPVFVYSSKKIDITNQVMDLFNKRYLEKTGKNPKKE